MSGSSIGARRVPVLRDPARDPERVTYVELFFDLVFAFAVTQIAGLTGDEPTFISITQSVIVTAAVWWVWVYTAWATNWLNPDAPAVLWMLLGLTAIGLVLSESIPEAFAARRAVFVGAYLVYGLVRTLGVIAATRTRSRAIAAGQWRILVWSAVAGVFWVVGAAVPTESTRVLLWAVAIIIEYAGPAALFWVPGVGRSSWESWRIRGGHFSERAALFMIIVLGESILVVGAGLSEHALTPSVVAAAVGAFAEAVVLWYLYFAHGQERGRNFITKRESTGPVARLSYTYLHVVIVLGLVAATHGAHLALERPLERPDNAEALLVLLGPAIYLLGLLLFKRSIGIALMWIPSHLTGMAVLALLWLTVELGLIAVNLLSMVFLASLVLVLLALGDELLWQRRSRERAHERTHPEEGAR